jgi:coenzyme F420-reducing hydrogenase delta subunit
MLSSAMANEFVKVVEETVNVIKDLGPNPLRDYC